jgi:hypothetical protein
MPTPTSQMLVADIAPVISTAATRICGAASAIRNNAQLRVINEVGRIEWAFQNYSVSCSKVIAAYFGASVRSIAAFGARQADDR